MGNATKVALVALLILLVVVVARFVREDSTPDADVAERSPAGASTLPGKVPARAAASTGPAGQNRAPDLAARGKQSATIPSLARNPAPGAGHSTTLPGHSTTLPGAPSTGQETSRGVASLTSPATSGPSRVAPDFAGATSPRVASPGSPAPEGTSPGTRTVFSPIQPGSSPVQPGPAPQPQLPPPNPIGSLEGTSPSPAPAVRRAESEALVETRLPGGDAPREAPSPFRPLAESGREIRGSSPPIQGDLSSGVAREPTRTEKSSAPGPAEPRSAAGGYPKTHVVVKGDSFWGLADRYYGDGTLSPVLVKANPGMKLRPGMKVTIPEPPPQSRPPAPVATGSREERAPEKPAAPAGSRDYVVQKGDTLGLIARKFYGDPAKLHLIEEANPDLKYQMLQAGARIKVPARAE